MFPPPLRLGFVAAFAVAHLSAYRVAKLVRGPSRDRALARLRSWSGYTCRALDVDVRLRGELPAGRCVYVANHRSYLDIPILSSVLQATFLSNDDVARWPVIGAAAHDVGVVFVDRAEMRGRIRALRQITRCLQQTSIVVFPEGTTTGERLPREFHSGLFRLLRRLRTPAVPVTLRYSSRDAYWVEDLGIGEHLRQRVLANGGLSVDVHVGAPIVSSADGDGEAFAASARASVCGPIEACGELAARR